MSFRKSRLQTPEARARAAQTELIEDSVKKVRKHFGALCNDLGSICRRTGKLRDRYDGLAKTCLMFADVEMGTLKKSLTHFAENISAVQDYRQAQIERIERCIVEPLKKYSVECKHTETDLSRHITARKREEKQHEQTLSLRNKSANDNLTLSNAELELQKRSIDVARSTQSMEQTIDKFENQKVKDLKKFLREFVKIEMIQHAKSLEILSSAYKDLGDIDEDDHMEKFRNALRPSASMNISDRLELTSPSNSILRRDSSSKRRPSSAQHKDDKSSKRKSQKRLSFEDELSETDQFTETDEEDNEFTEDETESEISANIKPRKPW